MIKISEKQKKDIEKNVNKYCKSLDIKDEEGVKTGTKLLNNPHVLLAFYRQPFFLELLTDEERLHAKMIFKNKLPYKEWANKVGKTPGYLRSLVEDFQEMVNPKYERKTERRNW